ncbi:CocE/NonD family hydrolase [Enterococcus sp. ALS3]|uniref:CocE/NonD family hydrolase n=1 Tax=Enterococcus alishanensis TaxID=1303817 RepID=A0ABS6TCL5_9ENTE|nr:CocE/NonD family hydrolase [Enterococcus alishanensis]MBV7390617.1 CocE/NonD family hydrolase [Enterococcus alishanensis]
MKRIIENFPYDVEVIENSWYTLSDGTVLSYRGWFPKSDKPLPTILEYLPYRKTDGTRGRDNPMHGYFSGHGYNVIRMDMRGTGESEGLLKDEYLKQEQDDALEIIDWIAKQDWCDGNVGMMGKSWGGFNSLQIAARQPEALKAVMVVGFTDDRYNNDIHYKGGLILNDNFWWGAIMLGYQSRAIDPHVVGDRWREMWLERLKNMPLWMANWLEHQTRDDYWKHGSVCENYDAIKVPVFAVDGYADSYTNTVLSLLEGLSVPKKGILGPWAHVYAHDGVPGPAINYLGEGVKWWDHWLKGEKTDTLDGPMIQAWIEDSMPPQTNKPESKGRWVAVENWPSKVVNDKNFGLSYHELVAENANTSEKVALKTPLNHTLLANEWMGAGVPGESPGDQRLDNGLALNFDSEVLTEDLEIFGYPKVTLKLSSDKPNAMLYASLCDVAPDGSSERVSYGVMNLTHLAGHDKVVYLEPGKEVEATVQLNTCGHSFKAGHRLRLSLANSAWPMFWTMPEDNTLTLELADAQFSLPIFTGEDTVGPDLDAQSAPLTPTTILSEGRVEREISYDLVTDTWTCMTNGIGGVFGEGIYRFDEIDVTVEHNLKRLLTLSNQDPLSANYTITQNMRIGREGWWTNAEITTTQTSDKEYFYITGEMNVTENEEPIYATTWDKKIKRNGM